MRRRPRRFCKRPLLIVPPWINKFYILDLNPRKVFIRWAVAQGLTVFVISWVNPDARHATKSFEAYMREGILAALDAIETGDRREEGLGHRLLRRRNAACRSTLGLYGRRAATSASRARRFFATQVDFGMRAILRSSSTRSG